MIPEIDVEDSHPNLPSVGKQGALPEALMLKESVYLARRELSTIGAAVEEAVLFRHRQKLYLSARIN